jgi:hypothetical protein
MQANAQRQAGADAAAAGLAQQQEDTARQQQLQQAALAAGADASHRVNDVIVPDAALTLSAARARAAASGTTTTSPGVVTALGRLAGRAEYNVEAALAAGDEKAQELQYQSTLTGYEGGQAALAWAEKEGAKDTEATLGLIDTAGSLFAKYGGGGPSTTGTGFTTASRLGLTGLAPSVFSEYTAPIGPGLSGSP